MTTRRYLLTMGGLALAAIFLFWHSQQSTTPPSPITRSLPEKGDHTEDGYAPVPTISPPSGVVTPTVLATPTATTPPTRAEWDKISNERVFSFYSTADMNQFIENAHTMGLEILDHMELGHSVRVRVADPSLLDAVLAVSPSPVRTDSNYHVATPTPPASSTFEASQHTGFGSNVLPWLGVPTDHRDWGKGVTIAILDTPANAAHATAVQSLIAGSGDTLAGISPAATTVTLPVLSADGTGDTYTLAKAIVDAVDQGADIINMSVGSYGDSDILRDAVAYATSKGVVLVAAAGNDALDQVCYPARYDGVIAVGAIDASGQHMEFSNTGTEIDITAPGVAILVASTNVAGEELMSGTSMATPLVSGALAALASVESISVTNAVALLLTYANDEGRAGDDVDYGDGIMNLPRVLSRSEAGIYDVAVGQPWITADPNGYNLHVYVENRGTETLNHVTVSISVGGVPMTANFYSVKSAVTQDQPLSLDFLSPDSATSIAMSLTAAIEGHEDSHMADNACQGTISRP